MPSSSSAAATVMRSSSAAAFGDPRASSEASSEQVGRTERASNTTGDGNSPGRAFHDEVLGGICFEISGQGSARKPWDAMIEFNS
jgi:hypothetical protein